MVSRRGSTSSGCLTTLLFMAAVGYLAYHVGQPYFRYYQFRDAVDQEARFASMRTDDGIRQLIWTQADSLSLPDDAYQLDIERTSRTIHIWTSYDDQWTVGRYTRRVHFDVDVERPL